ALKRTASLANNPNNELGYGIPNYQAVVNYLEAQSQSGTFVVYPNPVSDTLIVKPDNPEEITSCEVELISSTGQLLKTFTPSFSWLDNVFRTDISDLSQGL